MSGIFFTSPLTKTATNGAAWAHVDAWFPTTQVFANVMLSHYSTQTPERFASFQPTWAEAYIVTPQTPMSTIAGVSWPSRRDNTVFLSTDRLTFWLQVSNGGSSNPATRASAVGVIYDFSPAARFELRPDVRELFLAIYDEDGVVVGTHQSFVFDGAPDFDEEETRERVLAEAHLLAEREPGSLRVTSLGYNGISADRDFRVDVSTGRAEPVEGGSVSGHPFHV